MFLCISRALRLRFLSLPRNSSLSCVFYFALRGLSHVFGSLPTHHAPLCPPHIRFGLMLVMTSHDGCPVSILLFFYIRHSEFPWHASVEAQSHRPQAVPLTQGVENSMCGFK